MKKLETIQQFNEMKNDGQHVFMFSADWCPDCRVIDPILPDVEKAFPNFTFVYVDRDKFIDVCIDLDIFGIPSFVAFKDGEEKGRFVSKDSKTQAEIESFLAGLPA